MELTNTSSNELGR